MKGYTGVYLREAMKLLEVRKPIPILFKKGKRVGVVSGKFLWDRIIIRIGRGAELESVVYVILHELVHWKQYLENPRAFAHAEYRKMHHDNRPWEAEANYWAEKYTSKLLEKIKEVEKCK